MLRSLVGSEMCIRDRISCNLLLDPEPLLTLDAEVLRQYLYTRTGDLPPGMDRIPVSYTHLTLPTIYSV